jgi:hypothetical protein
MKNTFVVIMIVVALVGFIAWWNIKKVTASRMDCNSKICYDKKGNEIPIIECQKIGLIC